MIVYSLESHVVLPEMKIITLENLSVIDKIQSHSSDSDFENIKIKSIIKMWNNLIEEKIDCRKSYNL